MSCHLQGEINYLKHYTDVKVVMTINNLIKSNSILFHNYYMFWMKDDHRSYIRNFWSCEKKARKKFRLWRDSHPWPLWYRWSALPIKLTSQLRASRWIISLWKGVAEVKGSNHVQDWIFSGFLFATAKAAYITTMIILHLILHSAVYIYDFHIFITLLHVCQERIKGTEKASPTHTLFRR